jgi:hypothetical protein
MLNFLLCIFFDVLMYETAMLVNSGVVSNLRVVTVTSNHELIHVI